MHKQYVIQEPLNTPALCDDDLERIRRFTRKAVTAEELYTFPIVLCDNDVDRDLERFASDALPPLAELFVGKCGVFDHNVSGHEQTARIYKAECRTDPNRKTQTGEAYSYVYALAYMPRIEKNADLIAEIDSGIKKETSVGCAVAVKRCSVCGADVLRAGCEHRKGELYAGQVCHHVLEQPTDAYEWSFVAVPAQRNAGVTKSYTTQERNESMHDILKSLREGQKALTLSPEQQKTLCSRIDALEQEAALGKAYLGDLIAETLRAGLAAMPDMDGEHLRAVCEKASAPELKALRKSFGALLKERLPAAAQLCAEETADETNHAFQI